MVKNLPAVQETWIKFPDQEDLLERGMATHSYILESIIIWTEEPGCSPWDHKESDITE